MKMLYKIIISRGTINITSNHSKLMKNGRFEFKNSFTMRIRLLIRKEEKVAYFERVKPITLINEAIHIRKEITQLNSTAKMYILLFNIIDHCRFLMTDNPDLKVSILTTAAMLTICNV